MFQKKFSVLCVILLVLASCQTPPSDGSVEQWLTTADKSALFAQQPRIAFTKSTSSLPMIEVTDDKRFQEIEGFGFALTGGSAQLLMKMSPAKRTAIVKELFADSGDAIGVSYLRVSIGASDLSDHVFTYDDIPPGQADPELSHFDLGPDRSDVVPVLKEILAINPDIKILASPWTAPSWMKTNDLARGGSLKRKWYRAYAQYFVKYIKAMKAQRITINAVTIQNEPSDFMNTPSMTMTAKAQGYFIRHALGPAIKRAGLATDIILYDNNCGMPQYPLKVLADPATRRFVKGTGFHLYGTDITAMSKVHNAYPQKSVYFTEQLITQDNNETPFKIADPVSTVVIAATRNWSRNVLLWNLAADPHNRPHTDNGGCPVCQGALTLDGDHVARNLAYYTIAHASKFVRPGSVRIESESSGKGALPNVAFLTPDRKIVLLVANTSAKMQKFSVYDGGKEFTATLAAGDVATYIWNKGGG